MRKEMKLDSLEDLEKEATKQGISWEDFKQTQRNQIITRKVIGEEVSSHLASAKKKSRSSTTSTRARWNSRSPSA